MLKRLFKGLDSRWLLAVTLVLLPAFPGVAQTLTNPSFEAPVQPDGVSFVNEASVPGWNTTATDNIIEFWRNTSPPAFDLSQFVELNANQVSTLFQDLLGVPAGAITSFQFAHRGRAGTDTVRLTITDVVTSAVLFSKDYSTGNGAWVVYTSVGESPIVATGNTLRLSFISVSSVGGATIGNFLDGVDFGVGVVAPPFGFRGQIDEVEFFNRALGDEEIADIFNAGPFGKCKTGPAICETFPNPIPIPMLPAVEVVNAGGMNLLEIYEPPFSIMPSRIESTEPGAEGDPLGAVIPGPGDPVSFPDARGENADHNMGPGAPPPGDPTTFPDPGAEDADHN